MNETEEQISAARRFYNSAVMQYNNKVKQFPSNFIASMFNFKEAESFSSPQNEMENINVEDLFKK